MHPNRVGLHPSMFALLPVAIIDVATDDDCCSICLGDLVEPEDGSDSLPCEAIRLPCNHVFHRDCASQWLAKSMLCPLCKSNVALRVLGQRTASEEGAGSNDLPPAPPPPAPSSNATDVDDPSVEDDPVPGPAPPLPDMLPPPPPM